MADKTQLDVRTIRLTAALQAIREEINTYRNRGYYDEDRRLMADAFDNIEVIVDDALKEDTDAQA